MSFKSKADALMGKPHGIREIKFPNGNTADIISTMLWADGHKAVKEDTKELAEKLRGKNDLQTAYNVWHFVKKYVRYQLDPLGQQDIKAPAQTWKDGYADCKSRSIFQASLLKNLGLPYKYRFVSYKNKDVYTHVYVLIGAGGKWYASDPDMNMFNKEKPYKFKLDKNMSKISFIAGKQSEEGRLRLHLDPDKMTDFDMELAIRKQRAEIQKGIAERMAGIGCPHAEKMQDKIDIIQDMIEIRSDKNLSEEDKLDGIYGILEDVNDGLYDASKETIGIGDIGKKGAKRAAKKAKRQEKKAAKAPKKAEKKAKRVERIKKIKAKVKKSLKKVANVAKKVGKGLLKVATAPQRLAAKALLEASLPKMAPMFIYLFIKDPAIIEKLPPEARRKRKKSEKIAKFIITKIGMKEDHFMGIVRNGIMKRYQKSPEEVLKLNLKGKVAGLGDIGFWGAIIQVALKVIKAIFKAFGGKKNKDTELSENDMPDPQKDFGELPEEEQNRFADLIKQQPINEADTVPGEPASPNVMKDQGDGGDGSEEQSSNPFKSKNPPLSPNNSRSTAIS
jgi:hypothetical protein